MFLHPFALGSSSYPAFYLLLVANVNPTPSPRSPTTHTIRANQPADAASAPRRLTPNHQVVQRHEPDGAAVAVDYYGAGDLESYQQSHRVARQHVWRQG